MALENGTLLHKRYRIVEILGQGGMGSVYRAVDENLGVDVAVKENLFTSEEYARQFRLEAVILANLRHPNLPRVSDHFTIGEQGQYLIMDFVEGEDMRQRMERIGPLPEDDIIQIGCAMCDALAYLHTRKPSILHRDIKPGNVKITSEGHIVLVDFGLAKVSHGDQVTTVGARAMTPGYSPPEQYGTARTDPRTDIYALGATLYAGITGAIPEDGLARAMDTAELTPLRKRNSAVVRRLAATIEKAMSVDPGDRFQTAEEFKRALMESKSRPRPITGPYYITPPPGRAPEDTTMDAAREPAKFRMSSPPKQQSFVSPRKKQVMRESRIRRTIIGILLVIIVGGFLAANYFYPGLFAPGSQATDAPATQSFIAVDPVTPTITPVSPAISATPSPMETLVPTPLGSENLQVAFASTRSGISQIYMLDLNDKDPVQLTTLPEGACQPAWSPDGLKLVFISPCKFKNDSYPGSSLYTINADGTGLQHLQTVPGGDFEPDWSPDGSKIAFASLRTGYMQIYSYDLKTNITTRLLRTTQDMDARQPAWSPDGKQIVYALRRTGSAYQIWLMSSTGRDQRQIVRSGDLQSDNLPEWSSDGKLILFDQRPVNGFAFPNVMMISLEPDSKPVKLNLGGLSVDDVDYSPDGFWLVYESAGERGSNISYMTVTGANQTALTTDPSDDFDPAWRPVAK